MRPLILFLLCCSVAFCKYSYTDKCYRYGKDVESSRGNDLPMSFLGSVYYQYYFNRRGIPLSNDYIAYERTFGEEDNLMWSYYYQWELGYCDNCSYVLSHCQKTDKGFNCTRTCESVWFKIWNVTAAEPLGSACDKAFVGQYANVM